MFVTFSTNLDLDNERWPDGEYDNVPMVGDEVESLIKYGAFRMTLQVVKRTIRIDTNGLPYYHCELHMTNWHKMLPPPPRSDAAVGSITAFQYWYARATGKVF